MQKELIIIPHPNDLQKLADFQKNLCMKLNLIPVFPIFIRKISLINSAEESKKIQSVKISEIRQNGTNFFLIFTILFEKMEEEAQILIARMAKNDENQKNISKVKKPDLILSSFRVCEAEINEQKDSMEWKITTEKWCKPLS